MLQDVEVHRPIEFDAIVDMVRENFDSSGGREQWKPLAVSTLLARARNPDGKQGKAPRRILKKDGRINKAAARTISGAKPLLWSKALYRSIRFVPTSDYVDVGTPMIKGRTLFFGHSPVPARSPFVFRDGDADKIGRIYARHFWGDLVQ